MRIALITTGKTEIRGFPPALKRLFPGHEFVGVEEVPDRPFRGFTSGRLPLPAEVVPTAVDRLVSEAAALVDPDCEQRYDVAIILDDLELANRDQPGVVVEVVRAAALRHLGAYSREPRRHAALSEAFRTRVSFHIVRPMIESWFFGAPTALSKLGVPAIPYHIRQGDHEDFESTDRNYVSADESDCPRWLRFRDRGDRPKWIGAGTDRVFHPKGYIQWLMLNGSHPCCTDYTEAHAGAGALAALDWGRLLQSSHCATFARALVSDLASALGQGPAVASWRGVEAQETGVHVVRQAPVLRNI